MKRSFNIDRKYIKELITQLETYAPDMIYDLELLYSINDRLKHNFNISDDETDYLIQLKEQVKLLELYKRSYPHVKRFCMHGMTIDGSNFKTKYKRINISEQDSLDLSEEFFNLDDPFFSTPFKQFKKEAKDHLKFIAPSKKSEGEIHYIPSLDEYFMFVPRYNNITRVSILLHEIEHYIDLYNRYEFHKQYLIREFSAIFMEIIGCDWLAKKLKVGNDGIKRRFQIHTNIKNDSEHLFFKTQLLNIIKNNPQLSRKELLTKLYDCGFDEYNLNIFAQDSLVYDYYYQIPYLIATELYNLYQTDKEKALYIFKYIILNGTDENIFEILDKLGIVLNKSVHAYEKEMAYSLVKIKED